MEKLLLLLLPVCIHAQTYNVGSPVYDTVAATLGSVNQNAMLCPTFELTFDDVMQQDPPGTQVYLKITGGNFQPNALHEVTAGTINVGDSLIANALPNASWAFYSTNGNYLFNYAFIRVGVPVMQGDSFHCNDDITYALSTSVDACQSGLVITHNYYSIGTQDCTVGGPANTISSSLEESSKVFPNPSDGLFCIVVPEDRRSNVTIVVYDLSGREIQSVCNLNRTQTWVDLTGEDAGVYTYLVSDENGLISYGRLIVE